jgi:hypothetical protein
MALHACEEALPRVLVDDIQDAKRRPIVCPLLHEIIAPHVVAIRRSQPDARVIIEPQMASFGLPGGYFQTFSSPDQLDTFFVHDPAAVAYQARDTSAAIATILTSQDNHSFREFLFVGCYPRLVALRGPRLLQDPAGSPLGHVQLLQDVLHELSAPGRADYFFDSASSRIDLSNARSATSFFSRVFSRSRSFSRLAWLLSIPPYSFPEREQLVISVQREQTKVVLHRRWSRELGYDIYDEAEGNILKRQGILPVT